MGHLEPGNDGRKDSIEQNVCGKSSIKPLCLARDAASPLKKSEKQNPGHCGRHELKFPLQCSLISQIDSRHIIGAEIKQKEQNADLQEVQCFRYIHARVPFFLIQENGHHKEHAVRVEEESDQRDGRGLRVM